MCRGVTLTPFTLQLYIMPNIIDIATANTHRRRRRGQGQVPLSPKNQKKIFFGQLLREIRAFFGQKCPAALKLTELAHTLMQILCEKQRNAKKKII